VIVIDTSALIAVTNHEPERQAFLDAISQADRCLMSAVTLLETRMVVWGRFGIAGVDRLKEWLEAFDPEIVAFDASQADAAFTAFTVYGKGVSSTARLNFGDCAAYALAKTRNLPLLYKGKDFAATDLVAAIP